MLVLGSSSGQGGSCYERASPELYPRLPPAYAPAYQPPEAATSEPAFYAPAALNPATPYSMKEGGDPWRSISQSASYYYDPTLAAYGYGGLDFNGARRKNVTRDSTSTLKAWLNEHRKNPYPTKGEKIMLAIITKMTLTQVSTWFANARRRLKKENKMTWEPRNKAESHDDDANKRDDDKDEGDFDEGDDDSKPPTIGLPPTQDRDLDSMPHHRSSEPSASFHPHQLHAAPQPQHLSSSAPLHPFDPNSAQYSSASFEHLLYKPKIWSLADTATAPQQQMWGAMKYGPAQQQHSSCGFGRFGGGASFGGLLQTDTPPQTPPNMKVGVASSLGTAPTQPGSASSSSGSAYMEAYMGPQAAAGICSQDQLQDDKLDTYQSSHASVLPQSSSSNQNTASDCISEDFDDPSQYSTSSVR
ncbi:hypothetical protein JTE90_003493 [Oedothorax gibbosus]|uniref:Homeobox domain-containing protein n=1 Tax=Oedothorax gibbosus TaxID=931172 RepID=A0AAV6UEJ0_9ARAC|nr:hypothetical protein JTE90_003493 [Oedothorax gibbosus]